LPPPSLWSFAPTDPKEAVVVLVELGLVEQRYRAVCEVLDGATVTDVAKRNGVARQTVHDWLRAYAKGGMAALVDRSSKPQSCPHQMSPAIEARIVELRRANPGGGRARSCTGWAARGSIRCRGDRRCTGRYCVTG
jgi:transposase-like protein